MIIQGALEVIMGGLLAGFAFFVEELFENAGRQNPNQPMPEGMTTFMQLLYGGVGVVTLVLAALHIYAGIRVTRYQGRTLGLVALGAGVMSIFTCYCAITAVPLFVWGVIVMMNEPVKRAFMFREAGHTKAEVDNGYR